MSKKEWKELFRKCFGKNKDERYHGIAMLLIYGIFLLVIVLAIRIGGTSNYEEVPTSPSPTPIVDEEQEKPNNYSYTYRITKNGISAVYLGKRVEDKEKFTAIINGVSIDYAILSNNFLILENGTYQVTDIPDYDFKYCNQDKILELVKDEIPTENGNLIKYTVNNHKIATIFQEEVKDLYGNNMIQIQQENGQVKEITLDFSSYFSNKNEVETNWIAELSYTDIGLIEDFNLLTE